MLLDYLYGWLLYESSLRWIVALQENKISVLKTAAMYFSYLGYFEAYVVILIILFNFLDRDVAFYFIFASSIGIYVDPWFKLLYHQPRPFYTDAKIKAWECDYEYGNPAGDSFFFAFFYLTLILYYFYDGSAQHQWLRSSTSFETVCCVIYVVGALMLGFSEFYVGAHTADQIIYGWTLGIWLALALHEFLRKPFKKHIEWLLTPYACLSGEIKYGKLFCNATLLFLLATLMFVFSYLILTYRVVTPASWVDQLVQKCGYNPSTQSHLAF